MSFLARVTARLFTEYEAIGSFSPDYWSPQSLAVVKVAGPSSSQDARASRELRQAAARGHPDQACIHCPGCDTDGRVLAARPKLEERVIDLVFGATPSQRDRHHAEILVYLVGDIAEEGEGGARHLPQHLLPGDVRLRARAQRGEAIQRVRARFLRASWLAIPTSAQCGNGRSPGAPWRPRIRRSRRGRRAPAPLRAPWGA
jgi:hypothetical protein